MWYHACVDILAYRNRKQWQSQSTAFTSPVSIHKSRCSISMLQMSITYIIYKYASKFTSYQGEKKMLICYTTMNKTEVHRFPFGASAAPHSPKMCKSCSVVALNLGCECTWVRRFVFIWQPSNKLATCPRSTLPSLTYAAIGSISPLLYRE